MTDKQLHSLMTAVILAGRIMKGEGTDITYPWKLARMILDYDPDDEGDQKKPTW